MPVGRSHTLVLILLWACFGGLLAQDYIKSCVYKAASRYRGNSARFLIDNIDFTLCTHYVYAYATVDFVGKRIRAVDVQLEEGPTGQFKKFNDAKKSHPGIKTLLSLGGPGRASSIAFEKLHQQDSSFRDFVRNAVEFLKNAGFDGVDIYWYPLSGTGSKVTDLVQALRNAFNKDSSANKLILTITIHGNAPYWIGYLDINAIQGYVNYVVMQTIDLHRSDQATFYGAMDDRHNIRYLLSVRSTHSGFRGRYVPDEKLILSVTALGHYMRLSNPLQFEPGSPTVESVVLRGPMYDLNYSLAYPEVCQIMSVSRVYYDSIQRNPYLVKDSDWVGYIDRTSLIERVMYVKQYQLAGIQFTALDEDDFTGNFCSQGRYPLLSAMASSIAWTTLATTHEPITTSTARSRKSQTTARLTKRTSKAALTTATTAVRTTAETTIATAAGGEAETAIATALITTPTEETIAAENITTTEETVALITTALITTAARTETTIHYGDPGKSRRIMLIKYAVWLALFVVGFLLGYVIMRFLRRTLRKKQGTGPQPDDSQKTTEKDEEKEDTKENEEKEYIGKEEQEKEEGETDDT